MGAAPALWVGLPGGLALFLYGMEQLSGSLRQVAGDRLKRTLRRLTTNRVVGVLTGAFATALFQSSTVTTVLLVGFLSAGLLTLEQSVGLIMGANIGSTVTAQLIAFHLTDYALLLVAFGVLLALGRRRRVWGSYGTLLLGIGLVFYGMAVMERTVAPLRQHTGFLVWMGRMEQPVLGILAGTLFTAVIQSSAATVGVVIVLASQGLIALPAAIAICLGANIGTCFTALLASVGRPLEARRAAVVHVLFNVLGALLWVAFIPELGRLAAAVSPRGAGPATPRQIANAHTLFNVINTILFVGFTPQLAALARWIVPGRPEAAPPFPPRPRYLDPELLSTPALALDRVRLEILHQGEQVRRQLDSVLPAILDGGREDVAALKRRDDAVDALHGAIVSYLGEISRGELTDAQTQELLRLLEAAHDLENIGDVIERNLAALGRRRIERGVRVSPATREVLAGYLAAVRRAYDAALQAVAERDEAAAGEVLAMREEIHRLTDSAVLHETRRLAAAEPDRLPAYNVERDILENLRRIYYFCKRMARMAGLPPEGFREEEPTAEP